MSFATQITRHPIAYEARPAQEAGALFETAPDALRDLVEGVAGCSPYLARLIAQEADWLARLGAERPEALLDEVWDSIEQGAGDLKPVFRQAKRRVAVLAALADLGGVWALSQVTRALTELADRCLDKGLRHLVEALSRGVKSLVLPLRTFRARRECAFWRWARWGRLS